MTKTSGSVYLRYVVVCTVFGKVNNRSHHILELYLEIGIEKKTLLLCLNINKHINHLDITTINNCHHFSIFNITVKTIVLFFKINYANRI